MTSLALLKDSSKVAEAVAEDDEVGVVTPEVTPQSVKETTPTTTTTVVKRDQLPNNWGSTVAAGISTGVDVVSRAVEKGAVLANKAIVMVGVVYITCTPVLPCLQGASKLRERMTPSEQPVEIPVSVHKGVVVADHVTGKLLMYIVVVWERSLIMADHDH